jgi:hypothetical protein
VQLFAADSGGFRYKRCTVVKDSKFWIVGAGMLSCAYALGVHAQDNPPQNPPTEQPAAPAPQAPPADAPPAQPAPQPSEAGDAGVALAPAAPSAAAGPADAGTPRGEAPVSPEALLGEGFDALDDEPEKALEAVPQAPRGRAGAAAPQQRTAKKMKAVPPLVIWATAGWGNALGPARCERGELVYINSAIHMASTLKHSVAYAGIGFAPAGTISDHPLLEWAAEHEPEVLAGYLASSGFSVLSVGAADLDGPLMRYPQLSEALVKRGVMPVASNLQCNGQAYCRNWATAEKPLHVVERGGQRYVFISLLPDDTTMRVEPARGELVLQPLTEAWEQRTKEARASGAELVVSSIDHGPDATAAARIADLLADLPRAPRPDLLLSPSAGENLLFMRPIDVQPAVVGTRRGVVTGIRVTKLQGGKDADVLARGVRLYEWDDPLSKELNALGARYCKAESKDLAGGQLELPITYEGLVPLAAAAARELADADVAVVDPLAFDSRFERPDGVRLQRGEIERSVVSDAPLVTARVPLDWLAQVSGRTEGPRPLMMSNYSVDNKIVYVAGREAVVGATYRVVTTSVLARSDRLPGGPVFEPLDEKNSTLRGALLKHMDQKSNDDPRRRVENLALGTQWVLRTDGQLLGNLTQVTNGDAMMMDTANSPYQEPALKVNKSGQLGVRFVLNYDADAPKFLYENALNIAFDNNFVTDTRALDLSFIQSSYTYRGLWPAPLFYPHPFVEAYAETQLGALSNWLLRPKLGVRSNFSRVASFKAYGAVQYKIDDDPGDEGLRPGVGAEFQLKPWTVVTDNGTMQFEGSVIYFWNSPGVLNQHLVRAQLISSYQIIGPLQMTLTAIGAVRKDDDKDYIGRAIGLQAGIRLRFVSRAMAE